MNKFLDAVLLRRADEQVESEGKTKLCIICHAAKPQGGQTICYKCWMKTPRSQLNAARGITNVRKKRTCR